MMVFNIINQMNQSQGLTNILVKIRAIQQNWVDGAGEEKGDGQWVNQSEINQQSIMVGLNEIEQKVQQYKILEEEYHKLQTHLQHQETEIRKKIGVEQQLRLYTDALKLQVQDLEKEKLELLDNSKHHIKQLKKNNQLLFTKLYGKIQNNLHLIQQNTHNQSKNQSLSHKKHQPSNDKTIREIIKTQYIERDNRVSSNSHKKKPESKKKPIYGGGYSTITEKEGISKRIDKMSPEKDKKIGENHNKNQFQNPLLRKKQKNLFSNYTLFEFLNSNANKNIKAIKKEPNSKKRIKRNVSSQQNSCSKKRLKTHNQSNSKIKSSKRSEKQNKSIFSVGSLNQNG